MIWLISITLSLMALATAGLGIMLLVSPDMGRRWTFWHIRMRGLQADRSSPVYSDNYMRLQGVILLVMAVATAGMMVFAISMMSKERGGGGEEAEAGMRLDDLPPMNVSTPIPYLLNPPDRRGARDKPDDADHPLSER